MESQKNDEELVDLLDSALKDFGKSKTSDEDLDDLMNSLDRDSIQKAANNFNKMLETMAKEAKKDEHVQAGPSQGEDDKFMSAINGFLQQNKGLADAPDEKGLIDALQNMDEKNPMVDDLMGAILQTALSRDVMYPAVKEMCQRFDVYLEEKTEGLDAHLLSQYTEQRKIIGELCKEYENEDGNDNGGENSSSEKKPTRIAKLWMDLQKQGVPPPEVAESMPGGELFADDGSPGMPGGVEGCSVM